MGKNKLEDNPKTLRRMPGANCGFEFEHAAFGSGRLHFKPFGVGRRSPEDRCPAESSPEKYKDDEAIYRARSLAEKAADVCLVYRPVNRSEASGRAPV